MKYLFLLLLVFPTFAYSQDRPDHTSGGTEVGINLGQALDNLMQYTGERKLVYSGYIRSSISLLRSKRNIQYGLTIEGGTNSRDFGYLSPALVLNRKFTMNKAYFYVGGMAGYIGSTSLGEPLTKKELVEGYVFGAQAGYACPIGKRLSFNAEFAVRRIQEWEKYGFESSLRRSEIYYCLPLAIGIRYRLSKQPQRPNAKS